MRQLVDKLPGQKTITLVVIATILNALGVAGVVDQGFAQEITTWVLFPAALGTAYLGVTRK